MDQHCVESSLADLELPGIRFFETIDSTNDEAWRWVDSGAQDRALVVADEQTAGRGRLGRRWITPAGTSLAFSLVLRIPPFEARLFSRLAGLGAVAVCSALQRLYSLPVQVKWPNDVLVNQRKAAGVLVEARWEGEDLQAVVVGIGINIAPESISAVNLSPVNLNYPVTCIEQETGHPVDRLELLHAALVNFYVDWLPRLSSPDFIHVWEGCLAFRGQWVELSHKVNEDERSEMNLTMGKVIGINQEGALQLISRSGDPFTAEAGEVQLRPVSADENSYRLID